MLRFEQLEYIIAIAETGSFREAAQKLFVTPQAISVSMKQLEEEAGRELFVKGNNKTFLTVQGEKLLEFARKTLQEKDIVFNEMRVQIAEAESRCINVASTSCIANMTLPKIIADWEMKNKKELFNISSMDNMISVLELVESGEKDIGLISMNAQELHQKFDMFSDNLQMEILVHDELVVVINRKNYTGEKEYITLEEYIKQIKTQYNIEPIDKWRDVVKKPFSANSNDADFHRAMLELTDASVTMSGLSYQYFFNNKKYVALPLENYNVTILHVAVYRKDADATIQEIVRMIRKEMHLK